MLKRLLDLILSVVGVFVLAPVILIVYILVRLNLGAPVFFKQVRPGMGGRAFEMIKFRTMRDANDAEGNPLEDAVRLTRLGKFLRASSLDELPELWNVVKGDMSLVGPRPLLMEYLPLYDQHQSRRHLVRPGITGWAQINGRNSLSWQAKFDLDVWYVDNRTIWLDIKIIFFTFRKVLVRDGISAEGEATMSKFTGNGR